MRRKANTRDMTDKDKGDAPGGASPFVRERVLSVLILLVHELLAVLDNDTLVVVCYTLTCYVVRWSVN